MAADTLLNFIETGVCDPSKRLQTLREYTIQPAHLDAWKSSENNALCNHFFDNTLAEMQSAYMRPRFPGWNCFQEAASGILCKEIAAATDSHKIAHALNAAFFNILN